MPKHKSFPGCFSENKPKRRCKSDLTENPDSDDETRQLMVKLKQDVLKMESYMRRTMACLASPVVDRSIKLTEVRRQLQQQQIYLRKTMDFLYTDHVPVVELDTDMDSSLSSTTGHGYHSPEQLNKNSETGTRTSEKLRYEPKVTVIAQSDKAIEKQVKTVKKSAEASKESTERNLEKLAEHPANLADTSDSFGIHRLAASSSGSFGTQQSAVASKKLSLHPAKVAIMRASFGTQKSAVASEKSPEHPAKVAITRDSFGTLVWSRFTQKRWWPAFIIDGVTAGQPPAKLASAWLMWFGDHKVSKMKLSQIEWIGEKFLQRATEKKPRLRDKAVAEAVKECAARLGIVCADDNVAKIAEVIQTRLTSKAGDPVAPTPDWSLPLEFTEAINTLKAGQKDQKAKTVQSKVAPAPAPALTPTPAPSPVDKASTPTVAPTNKSTKSKGPRKPQETQAAAIPVKAFSEKDVEQQCLGCGSGLEEGTHCFHPLFEGKLCSQCQDLVSEAVFSMDARGYYDRCCVCGTDSNLKVCNGNNCARAYCGHCLEKFGVSSYYEKTRAAWQCSLCTLYRKSAHGLLRSTTDWRHNLVHFFNLEASNVQLTVDKCSVVRKERGIRVLSLADGIAAVRVALQQMDVNVDAYYTVDVGESASLDKVAKEIITNKHENWVVHLGDLLNLEKRKLQEIAPIDLIVMNKATMYWNRNKDFNEAQGLLLKFLLALKQLKLVNPAGTHVFWLLESSVFISASCRKKISKLLKVPSCMWDCQFFAPVMQPKLYWGNLPGLHRSVSFYKEHRSHDSLESYLDKSQQRKPKVSIVRPTAVGGLLGGSSQTSEEDEDSALPSTQFTHPILMNGSSSQISVQEMERLMGFPEHYTDCQAEDDKRLQLLASSSVLVLKQLLKPLKDLFN